MQFSRSSLNIPQWPEISGTGHMVHKTQSNINCILHKIKNILVIQKDIYVLCTICTVYYIDSIYTSSRIVRVAAASELAQEFWMVLPPKVKVRNSTSSVYSRLYGMWYHFMTTIYRNKTESKFSPRPRANTFSFL